MAHKLRVNSINKTFEQIGKELTGEEMIERFMKLELGKKITGKELSNWDVKLSKAGKFINYIQRTKSGLYLDLKFGVELASSLTSTKMKDKSNFTIEKVNYYHVKGPGTLRGDPINIYIFNNSNKLKLDEKTSWKLF